MSHPGALRGAYRAERRKLVAQVSTRVLALVCGLGPFAFAAVLSGQSGVPGDTLLGAWVHGSGYAFSLVVLGFGGYLGFPVLAGALAGDILSCEDRYGTWKTILTRSGTRRQVFAGSWRRPRPSPWDCSPWPPSRASWRACCSSATSGWSASAAP